MIAQYIFDKLIGSNQPKSLLTKVLKLVRKQILTSNDPIVNYTYKGKNLAIHLSHDFPYILKDYPQYSQNLGWVIKKMHQKYADLKVIDVGANIGDSAVLIKDIADVPILCIEGNPKFLDLLKLNTTAIVGASSDKTGNIYAGGDWVLENTSEDIEMIYFTSNIQYYQY
jgi:hypothetical protein